MTSSCLNEESVASLMYLVVLELRQRCYRDRWWHNVVLGVDSQKELSEYKLKLKRAEQEITTLEGNVCISSL